MLDLIKKAAKIKKENKKVYDRLKADLIKLLDAGTIAPGTMLPPENSLAIRYKICRTSVRLALKEIEAEGRIFRRPGKGTFAKDINAAPPLADTAVSHNNIGLDMELPSAGEDWYGSKIFHGVEEACASSNCRIVFFRHHKIKNMRKGMIDGLISTMPRESEYDLYERLEQHKIYPVLINRITEHEHIAYFSVNYRKESERAINFLLDKGHRRFGIVTSGSDNPVNNIRYLGYCDAVAKYGSSVLEEICDVPPLQPIEYYAEAIASYLKSAKISAIFLLNGCFAIPLFMALQRLAIKVPDDLEIMCFDDAAYSYLLYGIPFNYVKMPLFDMGHDAAEYLMKKFEYGKKCPVIKKIYNAELVSVGYKTSGTSN
jgi:DNA-binding LacI/PurR family transcriptional regulator/DNA-binding transcriptional regulator YhcF (GntR family)